MKTLLLLVALFALGCEFEPGSPDGKCRDTIVDTSSWSVSSVTCREEQQIKILDEQRILCLCKDGDGKPRDVNLVPTDEIK